MSSKEQRKTLWRLGTGIFLGVLVLLVVTGRMHWIGAAIGALLPFLRAGFGLLMQALPLWLKHKQGQTQNQGNEQGQQPPPVATAAMNITEALGILGLTGDLNKGEITQDMVQDAHRRLIQKLHPDRGGNDYLAAKINQARDILINNITGKP
ncbi:molecular chaperone DnaJ [Cellvibrio fontiphilus]|uniref:Molecular chaperone DnaJ n=1 Tax=Cellvibrio fontiphilus TaxID=1815559 RepID=A0ABV7FET8_9GAMM